jgi:CelD/BcsL family acetyltransferase involved in cellulose biosynthesis
MKPGAREGVSIRVVRASELAPSEAAAWAALQAAEPLVASPFFRPEFASAVAAVREDARVAILEDAAGSAGFFPFQIGDDGSGGPMGGMLSDYQGVIARAGVAWKAVDLIRGCGLRRWRFDHLVAAQAPFAGFHRVLTSSPVIDLSAGYEAYVEERRRAGTEQIKKALGLRRKLEREMGPVRVETHAVDPAGLRQLMAWKSAQYLASGKRDIFALPWVAQLVERLHASQHADFAGMLSVLYVGERLVAAHMGMRSRTVWHYWLPAYDPACAHFSPGILLLLGMAEKAASLGLRVIDMGCGRTFYKERLMNGAVAIAEGEVAASPFRSAMTVWRNRARDWARRSPLRRLRASARPHGHEEAR